MPAKLIVTSGNGSVSEFQIEEPVLRIGSGRHCEFCLQGSRLAAHAVTVEWKDKTYRLHNRSDDPIELSGKTLEKKEWAPWSAGEEADFGHGVTIRLDIDGDPAPAKAAGPVYVVESDPDEQGADENEKKKQKAGSSKTLPLVAILVAVPLCGMMLMMESGEDNKPTQPPPSFSKLLEKLKVNKTDIARGPHSFHVTLQRARTAELRGDRKEARALYGSVRDSLQLAPRSPDGKLTNPEDDEVWNYVSSRLRGLYGAVQ